jgi:ribosomal protein S18 acetylase RimI-like enzyme
MVVKPEYRNHGVATKLYKKTFELLNEKGCFWAWTLVKEGNERIAEVLTQKGFTKGNRFNAYFKSAPF